VTIELRAPDRRGHIPRGARRIGWTEWGPSAGTPVVFCAGAGTSSSLGFGADVLAELGLRLRCVDRAGLGRSDPDPDKTLASYAADVRAVLADDGLAAAPVIGFSQGAPFAVALAGAGVATSIALVSPQDELAHPRLRPLLHPEIAALVDAIARDRAGFEAALGARADADGMWRLVVDMSAPIDRARYTEPGFAAAYRQALAEGFAHGPAGYVRDLVLALAPWSTRPEEVACPVELWCGALDTSLVHSPDAGATLATRFRDVRRHVLPDEGGSLLWTRSREILASLRARA